VGSDGAVTTVTGGLPSMRGGERLVGGRRDAQGRYRRLTGRILRVQ
jgi:hypothetical protein